MNEILLPPTELLPRMAANGGVALALPAGVHLPALIERAGPRARRRALEFFSASLRNANTRAAYGQAIGRFLAWAEAQGLALEGVDPVAVSLYVEGLSRRHAPASVKQHLAAVKVFFDHLVSGGVLEGNPAAAVRGPRYSVGKGKTPVLYEEDARGLLSSIDTGHVVGLRDRALLGVMIYTFARVGAAVGLLVGDYHGVGRRSYLRLHEKGGKEHEVPVQHKLQGFLDEYVTAAGIAEQRKTPLFRSTVATTRKLTDLGMDRRDALRMIKRRCIGAGLPPTISCHSFRATGITNYLQNGGSLDRAQRMAAHASPQTTRLYDRTEERVDLAEFERIHI